jgi:hypothetical protein
MCVGTIGVCLCCCTSKNKKSCTHFQEVTPGTDVLGQAVVARTTNEDGWYPREASDTPTMPVRCDWTYCVDEATRALPDARYGERCPNASYLVEVATGLDPNVYPDPCLICRGNCKGARSVLKKAKEGKKHEDKKRKDKEKKRVEPVWWTNTA